MLKIEEHNIALSIFILHPPRNIGLDGKTYLKTMKKTFSVGLAPSAYALLL